MHELLLFVGYEIGKMLLHNKPSCDCCDTDTSLTTGMHVIGDELDSSAPSLRNWCIMLQLDHTVRENESQRFYHKNITDHLNKRTASYFETRNIVSRCYIDILHTKHQDIGSSDRKKSAREEHQGDSVAGSFQES